MKPLSTANAEEAAEDEIICGEPSQKYAFLFVEPFVVPVVVKFRMFAAVV